MKWNDFNQNWEFQHGEPSGIPMLPQKKDTVSLPHDFMIALDVSPKAPGGAETGFYSGGIGSYTKYLELSEAELHERHILYIGGCFGSTKVVVNGHVLARHHYGYTPFAVSLDSALKAGKNRVTVTAADSNEPNSRWYSGAGLYRKVYLLTAPAVHIAPDGIFVSTLAVENGTARLRVRVTVCNDGTEDWTGGVQARVENETGETILSVPAGAFREAELTLTIPAARLWDLNDPQLYTLHVQAGDDADSVRFGVRTITVDAQHGLRLNGRTIKLKGGCLHHDNGILGAAAHRDSEYRKIKLHKENGFNAIRFAHNPPSKEILDACDELGLLVIDEAFDVWNMEKDSYDFSQYFEAEWEAELGAFVRRDRNHPSVFLWSIGNEIPEQGGLSGGYETSRKLAAFVRSLDDTRPVGGALCSFFRGLDDEDNAKYWQSIMQNAAELQKNGMVNLDCPYGKAIWDERTAPFVEHWDVVGYNYLRYHYEPSHEKHPERVICCTESKPRELVEYWADVERLDYLIGDFEWTSMDYLGEAGIGNSFYVEPSEVAAKMQAMHRTAFPARTADCGDFDLCGFEKPQLAFRRIVWGSKETFIAVTDPRHHGKVELLGRYGWADCAHCWTWPVEAGSPVKVEIFSPGKTAELFCNGRSLGRQSVEGFRAVFETVYEPGTLRAVSYDENGDEISADKISTYGKPAKLRISSECGDTLPADGESLCYAVVEITDEDGNLIPWAEVELTAEYTGEGTLLAFGSARPTTEENYTSGTITAYKGHALAVIRAAAAKGQSRLTVKSKRFGEAEIELHFI